MDGFNTFLKARTLDLRSHRLARVREYTQVHCETSFAHRYLPNDIVRTPVLPFIEGSIEGQSGYSSRCWALQG